MLRVFLLWPGMLSACVLFGYASVMFFGGAWVPWLALAGFVRAWPMRCAWFAMGFGCVLSILFPHDRVLSWRAWAWQERAVLPRIERQDADWAAAVRAWGMERFTVILPMREAGLAAGLLYGEARFSPRDRALIRNVGVSHMVAVSGANLGFLASLVSGLWSRSVRRRWIRVLLDQGLILWLVVLTGAPSSMVRAGGMALIPVWANMVGRPPAFLRSLLLSVMCIALLNPKQLFLDVGLQFSVMACLGLATASSFTTRSSSWLEVLALSNLWAWMWTLPIQVWVFHEWSWIGAVVSLVLMPYIELLQVGLIVIFLIPIPWLATFVERGVTAVWWLLELAARWSTPKVVHAPPVLILVWVVLLAGWLIHRTLKKWGSHLSDFVDTSTLDWWFVAACWGVWLPIFADTCPDLVVHLFILMLRTSAQQTRSEALARTRRE